jgi:hypothetical protein
MPMIPIIILILHLYIFRLRSLDGWLSYVVLKENILERIYTDSAFMLRANTAYRSLFWRLIESLELLSVLEQRPSRNNSNVDSGMWTWGSASRLASDSRVPKSSSVPARMANNLSARHESGAMTVLTTPSVQVQTFSVRSSLISNHHFCLEEKSLAPKVQEQVYRRAGSKIRFSLGALIHGPHGARDIS